MCIRDRYADIPPQQEKARHAGGGNGPARQVGQFAHLPHDRQVSLAVKAADQRLASVAHSPVSYTHLDVYKRQMLTFLAATAVFSGFSYLLMRRAELK